MTKQYIITEAERDTWLTIMRNNPQDPDAYYAITELQSLQELSREPLAWIWKFQDGGEEVVFFAPRRLHPDSDDIPTSITPLYTSPQPLQPITAEDVTDEMAIEYFSDYPYMKDEPDNIACAKRSIVSAVNVYLKHRGEKT